MHTNGMVGGGGEHAPEEREVEVVEVEVVAVQDVHGLAVQERNLVYEEY